MKNADQFHQLSGQFSEKEFINTESYLIRVSRFLARLIILFILLTATIILLFRWINPPTSSFMMQRQLSAWYNGKELNLQHRWTNGDNISPHLKMAAIASEDQSFATHWGLDLQSIQKAIDEYERGKDLRGASTITQQVAKNLFLWPESSYIRKGVEAYFAVLIDLFWHKNRILEVYLNIAEFGDGIYGCYAAATTYFGTTPDSLSKSQSALMVTALPAPKRYNLANPSNYMIDRSKWVLRYMDLLGNSYYLNKLEE